jgi:hypothetical protein
MSFGTMDPIGQIKFPYTDGVGGYSVIKCYVLEEMRSWWQVGDLQRFEIDAITANM